MHFLQESYEFVRNAQILQVCYSVEHLLQESDNIFAKFASISKKFLQKMRCVISTKNSFKIFWTHFVSFLNTPELEVCIYIRVTLMTRVASRTLFGTAFPEAACRKDFGFKFWLDFFNFYKIL